MVTNRHGYSVDITAGLLRNGGAALRRSERRAQSRSVCLLDLLADTVGFGRVPEVGSGPGVDAAYLEGRALNVSRTDATPAAQSADALQRIRQVVMDAGVLAFTVKECDGDAWSEAKLDLSRHFTSWRERSLREVLAQTRWAVMSIDRIVGRVESWLYVMARAD